MLLTRISNLEFQEPVRHMISRAACTIAMFILYSTASAQIGVSVPPTPGQNSVTCANMELMKQVPCSDSQMFYHEGSALVQRAINVRDFDELDKLYEQWCTGNDRFPDGRWKLSQYGDGLGKNFSAWNKWVQDLETIKMWRNLHTRSEAAQYAEAVYWRTYAWKARGSGYASSVSKEGWELFRERLNKSKDILDALRTVPPRCPAPYPLMLSVLTELGATEDQLLAVYSEGTSRFPEYHNIYFSMATHYQPKWGGSVEEYDAFATRAAEQTKEFEGMGMYARLYWLVDYESGIPFYERPSQPPEWKKLHAGYEDLMRKYPSSMHNLGKYVGVVCRTRDSKLYRELRSKIAGYEQSAEMVDPIDVCDKRHQWNSAVK
jgi:hypothetical protein